MEEAAGTECSGTARKRCVVIARTEEAAQPGWAGSVRDERHEDQRSAQEGSCSDEGHDEVAGPVARLGLRGGVHCGEGGPKYGDGATSESYAGARKWRLNDSVMPCRLRLLVDSV